MRKLRMIMAVMALALFAGVITASAQTTISFGNGGSGSVGDVTFIANSNGTPTMNSSASLNLGTCNAALVCTLSGSNSGGGTYSIVTTETSANQIQVSSTFISGLSRGISMDGATTSFAYTNGSGGFVNGTVLWSSLTTDGVATITGVLTITSSDISGLTGSAVITITTGEYGTSLFNSIFAGTAGTQERAVMANGSLTSTPEPSSMLLFGTGLLACGVFLRRRLA